MGRSGRTANFFGVAGFPKDSFSIGFDVKGFDSVRNSADLAVTSGLGFRLGCLGSTVAGATSGLVFSTAMPFDLSIGATGGFSS